MTDIRVQVGDVIWDKQAVLDLLDRSPQAVARALITIYDNQTADEQSQGETRHLNGVGFTGRDARWLTDVALKWKKYGRWASQRQLDAVRKSIRKYHRQLLAKIAEQPGAVVLSGRQKTVTLSPDEYSEAVQAQAIAPVRPMITSVEGSW